jgi:hypothetical protein
MHDEPEIRRDISEMWRVAAVEWVDLNAAADLREDTKSSELARMIMRETESHQNIHGKPLAHNRAEMIVKASDEWLQVIDDINETRRAANLARVRMDFLKMKFSEWQSRNANAREERRMHR